MELQDKYIIARWMYSIGEDFISDAEYDMIHKSILEQGLLTKYTERSWSLDDCPRDLLRKYNMGQYIYDVTHNYLAESIPSITEEENLNEFLAIGAGNSLSYKMDGFNCQVTYINGRIKLVTTRGRISDALNIGIMAKYLPQEINIGGKTTVVGELVLSDENFEKLKEIYQSRELQSQRSSVRSALTSEETAKLLTFKAFNIQSSEHQYTAMQIWYVLKLNGFDTPEYVEVNSFASLKKEITNFSRQREKYPYPTDGLVYRSEDGEYLKAIRLEAWKSPYYVSFITGYEETYGPQRIGMKLLIHPTRTADGATQRRVNVTNLKTIVQNGFKVNTPIIFKKVSDVIADIDIEMTAAFRERMRLLGKSENEILDDIRDGDIKL